MRLDGIYIHALGVCLPEPVDAETAIRTGLYEDELREESGFEGTHVGLDTPALDLAAAAGAEAIERGSLEPGDIDYFVHGGAYYQGPAGWATTGYIMRRIGLGHIASVQVNQECNGMMAALEVAIGQLTGAAGRNTVLLTSAANYATPAIDRWHELGPHSVLGDGGAAMVVTTRGGFAEVLSLNSETLPEAEGWQRGAEPLLPPRDGGGWRMNLVQRAIDHASATGESMQDWLDDVAEHCRDSALRSLADAKLSMADVTRVVSFHTARYAFEEQVGEFLDIPIERSNWECGRTVGHIGPCDHVVSLDRLLVSGALGPEDHVLLVSWGAGVNVTTAVLRVLERPHWATPPAP